MAKSGIQDQTTWAVLRSWVAPLIALAVSVAGCAHPHDAWDHVLETGVMRVGMDASFPPFESVGPNGELAGLDIDLAREIGKRVGVDVVFVANLPYDGLYDALMVERVDAVISALVVAPERMADFAFSTTYFDAGQVIVAPDESGIESMADLGGRTLAVELGTSGDLEGRRWARRLPDLRVAPYESASEATAAVTRGEADAALVDNVAALAAVPGVGNLAVIGKPVVTEPYAVATRRESRHLLRAIDEALAEMMADGTLETLIDRWISSAPLAGDTTLLSRRLSV